MPPIYVKPCPMPDFPSEQIEAMRGDARSLRMSPVDFAEKWNLPMWTAVCILTESLRYRIRHIKALTEDGGDRGWRF